MTEISPQCVAMVCSGVVTVKLLPVGMVQNRTTLSDPPAARKSSDRNSTLEMYLLLAAKAPRYVIWPLRRVYVAGTAYRYTSPAALPKASSRPFGLKASDVVVPGGWKMSSSENPGTLNTRTSPSAPP